MPVNPEARLVERLRAGDVAALEALMSEYASRVYRLAFGITRDQGDAEEVAQDVFLTLATKTAMFEERAALGSWVYRITTNAALNKRRGKRREVETSLEEHLPAFQADGHREGDRTYLLADWSQNPERELLSGETRRVLERALTDGARLALDLSEVTFVDQAGLELLCALGQRGVAFDCSGFVAEQLKAHGCR